MNFVHLVIDEPGPLGMEVQSSSSSTIVLKFAVGGQAEAASKQAMLDPDLFQGAAILGFNGEKYHKGVHQVFLDQEQATAKRPISIVFGMRREVHIHDTINIHKRYDGNFIELVFREKVLGIQLDNSNYKVVRVARFVPDTESREICKECLLDPEIFKRATILQINGKTGDRDALYQRLKSPARPKSVLFELAPPAVREDARRLLPPPTPNSTPVNRRASLKARDRAIFATNSVRKLSADSTEKALMFNVNESIRQLVMEEKCSVITEDETEGSQGLRRGLSEVSSVSTSMRQLQISMSEMETVNSQNDYLKEAMARSASSVASDDSPRYRRAQRVFQGLRQRRWRSSKRESSDVSADSETSTNFNRSIDFDGDFESEEEKEKALEFLKKEAYEACLDAIREHLVAFLSETPKARYEDWVEELHPENAQSRRNLVHGKSIDHRFYVEESDHRKLWNENLGDGEREFVPVRDYIEQQTKPVPKPSKSFTRSPPPRDMKPMQE